MTPSHTRAVSTLLALLVLFDASLVVWAFGLPELWFELFHGTREASAEALLFLRRCGASWGAFCLLQALAWWRWRREPVWLAVVAGVRLSDVFTDAVYAFTGEELTPFARLSLPPMGLGNLALGWFFLDAWRRARQGAVAE